MSSLRQGVLRAVRLLPDVVKIGTEPETALSSLQEEEQLSNRAASPEAQAANGGGSSNFGDPKEIKELKDQIAALEVRLSDAKLVEQELLGRITSSEAEAAKAKSDFAQKGLELDASAEAEKEKARAAGREQGYSEGLQSGHEAGLANAQTEVETRYREKFSELAAALEGMSSKLEERFSELVALNQPRMIRLWQEMLKKMLRRETALAPDAVLDVLSDVLSRLSDKNHILIYVSPEDTELLQASLQGEFEDVLRGVKHLEVKPDANVDRGSCIVETNLGVYDARWRTQLDQIEAGIENLLQKLGKPPKPRETARSRVRNLEDAPRALPEEPEEPEKLEKSAVKKKSPVKKKTEKKETGANG